MYALVYLAIKSGAEKYPLNLSTELTYKKTGHLNPDGQKPVSRIWL